VDPPSGHVRNPDVAAEILGRVTSRFDLDGARRAQSRQLWRPDAKDRSGNTDPPDLLVTPFEDDRGYHRNSGQGGPEIRRRAQGAVGICTNEPVQSRPQESIRIDIRALVELAERLVEEAAG